MMKDRVNSIYSELAGLIGNIVDVPKEYLFLIAVDGEGGATVHEVNRVLAHVASGQVLWITKKMESYTKLTNALQTWGVPSVIEDWLGKEVERLKEQVNAYELASGSLHLRIGQLEAESSRWREEAVRLHELMDELTEKYYSEVSHDDL